jgi:hypothetical protein
MTTKNKLYTYEIAMSENTQTAMIIIHGYTIWQLKNNLHSYEIAMFPKKLLVPIHRETPMKIT